MEKYVVLRRERQQNHYFVEASISTLNAAVGEGPFLALLIGPFPTQQNKNFAALRKVYTQL